MIILFHAILSIILFIIINFIGKRSHSFGYRSISITIQEKDDFATFNFIFKVFAPVIYIILISTACFYLKQDYLTKNIYLVCIYYIIIRFIVSIFTGKLALINWKKQIIYWVSIVIASLFTYYKLILPRVNILPDFQSMSNEVWLIIIAFLYVIFEKIGKSEKELNNEIYRKNKYIKDKYHIFQDKYEDIIDHKIKHNKLKLLLYSFMIFEDFNRPSSARFIENILFRFGKANTLGVMQVKTNEFINDKESVILAIDKIVNDLNILLKETPVVTNPTYKDVNEHNLIIGLIMKYNYDGNYNSEIWSILNVLHNDSGIKKLDYLIDNSIK